MPTLFADPVSVTTITAFSVTDAPTIVGLMFGLAGTFFVAIYYLRRRKQRS